MKKGVWQSALLALVLAAQSGGPIYALEQDEPPLLAASQDDAQPADETDGSINPSVSSSEEEDSSAGSLSSDESEKPEEDADENSSLEDEKEESEYIKDEETSSSPTDISDSQSTDETLSSDSAGQSEMQEMQSSDSSSSSGSSSEEEEEKPAEEKTSLQGIRVEKADQLKNEADYLIVRIGSSRQNGADETLIKAVFEQDKPVVLEYVWSDQNVNSQMEAYRFFGLVRNLKKAYIPLITVDSITPSTGPRYVRDMLDAFYGLTHIRPELKIGEQAKAKGDWKCLNDVYTAWDDPCAFEGRLEDLVSKSKPAADRKDIEELDRLYNPNNGEHFYTADRNERDTLVKLGWRYEGTGWSIPKKGIDVYRLYNPNAGDHHYTLNSHERDTLVKLGWKYEGVSWKSTENKVNAVYRAYNPNAKAGAHHFTIQKQEVEFLASVGWKNENIAWYSADPLVPVPSYPSGNYMIGDKCFNTNCVQVDGVQKVNTAFYYFNPDQDGTIDRQPGLRSLPDGSRILIEASGSLATGARRVEQHVYLFDPGTALSRRNTWNLMDGAWDNGRVSFMFFDGNGVGQVQNPPRQVEETYFVKNAGVASLVDPMTGVRIPFRDYIRAHYGNANLNSFLDEALKYEGRPYVWAGKDPRTGFDCSGLMTWCMRKQWGTAVNPMMTSAHALYSTYCTPISKEQALPGDLVFWKWTYGSYRESITHTGIYVGNGWTYQAGDPIGFFVVETSKNVEGQPAITLYGRPR